MGLFKGCLDSQAPFIIQISNGARKYTDKRMRTDSQNSTWAQEHEKN